MTHLLALSAGPLLTTGARGAGPPTSQHFAVTIHAVVHARKDAGQRGLAHPLLPYEDHPVVGVPRLGGDD